jgi:DNA damage-binding protein 1
MIKRFEDRGMSHVDADFVVKRMAQYEGFFVNLMVTEELGVQLPDDDDVTLLADAFVMMLAFSGFGALPLLIYCAGPFNIVSDKDLFLISASMTVFAMFFLGAVKSSFSSVHWFQSGLETVFVAALCAGSAFGIGSLISRLL